MHGFADFFRQKVEKITESTTIDGNVFNGSTKTETASENFFTEEKVSAVMKNLKDKSSYGYDNIPVKVLRDAHELLFFFLLLDFGLSRLTSLQFIQNHNHL